MLRSAAGAIGTDHHLMRVKIKLHLKSRKKLMKQRRVQYDITKFKDDKALESFQCDLRGTISGTSDDTISIDEKYSLFMEHLKVNAEKHFRLDKNTNRKRKEGLTDEILQIVDQKSLPLLNWQNHRGTNLEIETRNKYRRLRKLAKKKIDARQIEYWDEICEEIENSIKLNDPAAAFSIIRRLRGGSKRIESMPIKDKSCKLLLNSSDRLQRWREHFDELLNAPSTVDQKLIDEIQIDTLSKEEEKRQNTVPSIGEIRRALSQMKSRKAPGNDEAKVRVEGELLDSFLIEIGVQQDGIPSPILFNILFDFIIRKVIEEAGIAEAKFSYGTNDFFHDKRETYENFNILTLLYADDLAAMCEAASDLATFIRTFEKVTEEFGLTMSVKKHVL
ncbi:unnamed protein product [Rotaria sp. Silwood1]|nr:unnamed protein product [Rotaria sp. Silwood1]CAF1567539.1 unnamed protein product [Rotaria sp. Silwood1]CAF3563259.1 unnamed protein product [Rotaria sp. Silwood1]CAF3607985.1 unnamed protein product [Rotaria sp. Silwood1]CAF3616317.1 unnamed protein product [Rotaria sp. Silwood1]